MLNEAKVLFFLFIIVGMSIVYSGFSSGKIIVDENNIVRMRG